MMGPIIQTVITMYMVILLLAGLLDGMYPPLVDTAVSPGLYGAGTIMWADIWE